MRIIICGANKITKVLIKNLINEKDEIILIDDNEKKLNEIIDTFSINGVLGNSASNNTLLKAGVDYADMVIVMNNEDEKNLLTSILAKELGCHFVICKINSDELYGSIKFYKEKFKIDMVINADKLIAKEIVRRLTFPSALSVEAFANGHVDIAEIVVTQNSKLNGIKINEVKNIFGANVLVGIVERKGKIYIPKGDFVVEDGDVLSLVSSHTELLKCFKNLDFIKKQIKDCIIVGGSKSGVYLAKELNNMKINTKIIEIDMKKCLELKEKLSFSQIINGSGTDLELLLSQNIKKVDSVVALTMNDEVNISTYLLSQINNVPNIITYISNTDFARILKKVNVSNTISEYNAIMFEVLRCKKSIENLVSDNYNDVLNLNTSFKSYYKLAENKVEVIEFEVDKDFSKLNVMLSDPSFKLKHNVLIASVIRNGEVILPSGTTSLKDKDSVIIITNLKKDILKLEDIFTK
ncbi:MAG: Trk system potassium transporter TrkA [Clostridia bacterium]|nr:Trk system potassium transporter TrkA [Clostridia bacterium]